MRKVGSDEVMDREDVCHFDVERWLRSCVQIVELVDVEGIFGIWNRDDVGVDIGDSLNRISDVSVQWLEVDILAAKQSARCNLAKNFSDLPEISFLKWSQLLLYYTH